MYLISACLAGQAVRYDAKSYIYPAIQELIASDSAICACPEMLGGLPCPRSPAEIQGGTAQDVLLGTAKIIDSTGEDVTEAFLKGAQQTLMLAQKHRVKVAVLKEHSPSCGSSLIYDGTFSGKKVIGMGITAALLRLHGIDVISEQTFFSRLLTL